MGVKKQQPGNAVEQLLLPKQHYQTVCKLAHSIPIARHLGCEKTISRITQQFYWPTVYKDVTEYCQRCLECQRISEGNQLKGSLVSLPVMKEPGMDIVGPFPRSRRGNQYIVVVCDYATRYPEAIPLCSIDAWTIADHLRQLFSRVSIPKEILSEFYVSATEGALQLVAHQSNKDFTIPSTNQRPGQKVEELKIEELKIVHYAIQ